MSYLKRYLCKTVVAEFIRHTLDALTAFVLVFGALGALAGMLWCLVTDKPLLAIAIFCGYIAIFCTIVFVNFLSFRKYRSIPPPMSRAEKALYDFLKKP
jgi:cytochrome c biogenesis protein CcdA